MAKIRLSKSALAKERSQLQLYQRLLPSLDLKRRQLTVELDKARKQHTTAQAAVEELEARIGSELRMLAHTDVGVARLVTMKSFRLEEENVVGVRLPLLEEIECEVADYSLLDKAAWVDVLVDRLKRAAEERTRVQVATERVRILARAERRTTQRVNLFERVLIPEAKENIRRIQIYLGDAERSSVANSKLAKQKQQRAQKLAQESRR